MTANVTVASLALLAASLGLGASYLLYHRPPSSGHTATGALRESEGSLQRAPLLQPMKSLAEIVRMEPSGYRQWAIIDLVNRTETVDLSRPGGLGEGLLGLQDDSLRTFGIMAVITKLWQDDKKNLRPFIDRHAEWFLAEDGASLQTVVMTLAALDASYALDIARDIGGEIKDGLFREIARVLPLDHRVAMAATLGHRFDLSSEEVHQLWDAVESVDGIAVLKENGTSMEVVGLLVEALARQKVLDDPNAAITWAQSLPSTSLKSQALTAALGAVAEQSPAKARKVLQAWPGWQNEGGAVRAVARAMLKEDPREAVQWANESQTGRNRFLLLRELTSEGIQLDPRYAADVAEEIAKTSGIGFIDFAAVAGRFAEEDHREAWAWLLHLDRQAVADRFGSASAIAARWAEKDLPTALEEFAILPEGPHRDGFVAGIAEAFAHTDPQTGWDWLSGLDEMAFTRGASELIRHWAYESPEIAAQQLNKAVPDEAQGHLVHALTNAWATVDPASAAEWLQSKPEFIEASPKAVRNIVRLWAHTDPLAASTWLNEIPEGPARDQGAALVSQELTSLDPEASLEWAWSIQSESLRENITGMVLFNWSRTDREGALAAANEAGVSEQAIEKFLGLTKVHQ